ncbi:hypothetical protein JTB14_035718 [Gonioctena quinquepunctata]|nr:hypothetical protein JTB14_035718 [Gonioctena quinquepunctata]
MRVAGLLGAVLTTLGAAVKIFSTGQKQFFVVLIGQSITAVSQLFIWSVPPTIAVTWFKANEISTACSLAVSGILLGSAMGFVSPPLLVKNHVNLEDVGEDFKTLCWSLAIACAAIAVIVVAHFPKEPAHPPSQAQLEQRKTKQEVTLSSFLDSVKTLLKNKEFDLHIVSYSLNIGIFSSTGALLNPFVLSYFEGAQEDAGRMGFIMILIGVLGSILTGFVLDKTHRYKETAVFISLMCAVGMGAFLFALEMKTKWMAYAAISLFG